MTLWGLAAAIAVMAIAMSAIMAGAWAIERRTGNSGWVDVTWTFGVGLTGALAVALPFGAGPLERRLLVAAMAIAWALRLGLHIAGRTRGITDDARYAKLRQDWGDQASYQMFRFLQIQAGASVPLVLGIVLAANRPGPLGWQDLLGLAVFAAGWIGGGLADRQLAAFIRDPNKKGRSAMSGSGPGRGIRTISSNACSGPPMRSWRCRSPAIRSAGWRSAHPPS